MSRLTRKTEYLTIRINNFTALSAIGPNRILVNNISTSPDEFSLDLSHLSKPTPSPSFTYRLHDEDPAALAPHCPLQIKAAWKPAGDKLGLVLQYRLNPLAATLFPTPVTLSNVFISATYEGARASGAQSKPASVHLKDKHAVYWKLGDVVLSSDSDWSRIVCRIVGEGGAEPRPGHVEARWEYAVPTQTTLVQDQSDSGTGIGSGISVSRLVESKGKERAADQDEEGEVEDDPFADRSATPSPRSARTWVDVPAARRLVSGKYEAR